jgi:hypothetical protein
MIFLSNLEVIDKESRDHEDDLVMLEFAQITNMKKYYRRSPEWKKY